MGSAELRIESPRTSGRPHGHFRGPCDQSLSSRPSPVHGADVCADAAGFTAGEALSPRQSWGAAHATPAGAVFFPTVLTRPEKTPVRLRVTWKPRSHRVRAWEERTPHSPRGRGAGWTRRFFLEEEGAHGRCAVQSQCLAASCSGEQRDCPIKENSWWCLLPVTKFEFSSKNLNIEKFTSITVTLIVETFFQMSAG